MISSLIFLVLVTSSTRALAASLPAAEEGVDVEGNVTRKNRGAFNDWLLLNRGISEESGEHHVFDEAVVKKAKKTFLTSWCEWFGKRNGSARSSDISLCKHAYEDYLLSLTTTHRPTPSTTSAPVSTHSHGGKGKSKSRLHQTVVIVHRVLEEEEGKQSRRRRKRRHGEHEHEWTDDHDESDSWEVRKNHMKQNPTSISKSSSSSESAQDSASEEHRKVDVTNKPYFFV